MLSKRQSNILKFIYEHLNQKGFVPTIREIGQATQISSTSVVNYNLDRLVQLGYLVKPYGKSRALTLTSHGTNFVESIHSRSTLPFPFEHKRSDCDVERLQEENRRLLTENDRIRREHKTQIAALQREILYLSKELEALQHNTELYPA